MKIQKNTLSLMGENYFVMEGYIMTVEIGTKAPTFTLKNQEGNYISLDDFKGKNVVLYFYPKDMTPGCTTQACDFRDAHKDFSDQNTVDRKSTRLNSSHVSISYAVFCLKKKRKK